MPSCRSLPYADASSPVSPMCRRLFACASSAHPRRLLASSDAEDEEEDSEEEESTEKDRDLAVVLVHPYSILGGSQGLLSGIASGLAQKGYKAVTFDMRRVGRSTGRPSLTGFKEIKDVVAVFKWASQNLCCSRVLLVGSSAACGDGILRVFKLDDVANKSFKFFRINLPTGGHPTALTFGDDATSIIVASHTMLGSSLIMYGEEKPKESGGSKPQNKPFLRYLGPRLPMAMLMEAL